MNALAALRLMVAHYPGGIEYLAVLLDRSPEVLRKQLAGGQAFKLGVIDAGIISEACIAANSEHCYAYADAVAANCGGSFETISTAPSARDGAALQADAAGVVKEAADVLGAITAALADNVVSENEYKACSRELHELLAAVQRATQDLNDAYKRGGARPLHSVSVPGRGHA